MPSGHTEACETPRDGAHKHDSKRTLR